MRETEDFLFRFALRLFRHHNTSIKLLKQAATWYLLPVGAAVVARASMVIMNSLFLVPCMIVYLTLCEIVIIFLNMHDLLIFVVLSKLYLIGVFLD